MAVFRIDKTRDYICLPPALTRSVRTKNMLPAIGAILSV